MSNKLAKLVTLAVAAAAFVAISGTTAPAAAASPFARTVRKAAFGHEHITVHYSLRYEATRTLHNHGAAHRLANFLRSVGCHAHVHHNGHCYTVHYHCHGGRERCFDCDYEAHAFEHHLQSLGFHAHVHH